MVIFQHPVGRHLPWIAMEASSPLVRKIMATAALAKVQVAFAMVSTRKNRWKIAGFLMFFGGGFSGDGFRAFPRDKRKGCFFF